MHLDHINIKARQGLLKQIRDFYCEVLDLQEGPRPNFQSPGFWLYADGRPVVHLSAAPESSACPGTGYLDHVAFRAEGLAAFLARLQGREVVYRSSYIPELRLTQLFFEDPAGIGLEVNFSGEVLP